MLAQVAYLRCVVLGVLYQVCFVTCVVFGELISGVMYWVRNVFGVCS